MPAKRFDEQVEMAVAASYLSGKSTRELARTLHVDKGVITRTLAKFNIEQRDPATRNRKYALDPYVFDSIDNQDKAYWLGFLFADATVSKRSLILSLQSRDSEHLEALKAFMVSESPVKESYKRAIKDGQKYTTTKIEFTDEHLTDRLRELGIETGRPNPFLTYSSIPKELMSHFIRGFMDGDGSISLGRQGRLSTSSVSFCGDLRMLACVANSIMESTERTGSISRHRTSHGLHYLVYQGRLQSIDVLDYIYCDAHIYLNRKFIRAKTITDSNLNETLKQP